MEVEKQPKLLWFRESDHLHIFCILCTEKHSWVHVLGNSISPRGEGREQTRWFLFWFLYVDRAVYVLALIPITLLVASSTTIEGKSCFVNCNLATFSPPSWDKAPAPLLWKIPLCVSHARLLNLNQKELVQCSNKSNNNSGHYILLAMPKGLVCTLIGPNMGLCMRL